MKQKGKKNKGNDYQLFIVTILLKQIFLNANK